MHEALGATPEPCELAVVADADAFQDAGRRAVDAEDYAAARAAFALELELRRAMDDVPGVIYALVHLAWVLRIGLDEVAAARPLLGEAVALAHERSLEHVGAVHWNLGDQALSEGDVATAERLFREAGAPLSRTTRDPGTNGALLEGLAMAAAGQGHWERALHLFGAACGLRAAGGVPQVQPAVVARFARHLAPARDALGPEAAATAEAQGRALDLDQAIAYALTAASDEPDHAG